MNCINRKECKSKQTNKKHPTPAIPLCPVHFAETHSLASDEMQLPGLWPWLPWQRDAAGAGEHALQRAGTGPSRRVLTSWGIGAKLLPVSVAQPPFWEPAL